MNVNNLGLLNSLANIINEKIYDNDYFISEYILNHIDNIDTVSVNKMIEEVHVSRSAIRRFCKRLGYENFTVLKSSLSDIIFPSNIHLRKFESTDSYKNNLTNELFYIIKEMSDIITIDIIDSLSDLIHVYNNVSIVSSNNTSTNLMKFQQELFYAKKIVQLITNDFNNNKEGISGKESKLIIVVSISGVFSKAVRDRIHDVDGKKILITAHHSKEDQDVFEDIIYLSKKNINNDEFGLYGKYGITYFFDLLSENYIFKYKN